VISRRLTARVAKNVARLLEASAVRLHAWAADPEEGARITADDGKGRSGAVVDHLNERSERSGPVPPKHWLELVERHAPSLLQPSYRRADASLREASTTMGESPTVARLDRGGPSRNFTESAGSQPGFRRRVGESSETSDSSRVARKASQTVAQRLRRPATDAVAAAHCEAPRASAGDEPGWGAEGRNNSQPANEGTMPTRSATRGDPGLPISRISFGSRGEPKRDAQEQVTPLRNFEDAILAEPRTEAAGQCPASRSAMPPREGRAGQPAGVRSESRSAADVYPRADKSRRQSERRVAASSDATSADLRLGVRERQEETVSVAEEKAISVDRASGQHQRPRASAAGQSESRRVVEQRGNEFQTGRRFVDSEGHRLHEGPDKTGGPVAQNNRVRIGPSEDTAGAVEEAVVVRDHHGPREVATGIFPEITSAARRRIQREVEEAGPLIQPWPLLPDSSANRAPPGQGSEFWPELPGEEHLEPIPWASTLERSAAGSDHRGAERLRILELEQRGVRWTE